MEKPEKYEFIKHSLKLTCSGNTHSPNPYSDLACERLEESKVVKTAREDASSIVGREIPYREFKAPKEKKEEEEKNLHLHLHRHLHF